MAGATVTGMDIYGLLCILKGLSQLGFSTGSLSCRAYVFRSATLALDVRVGPAPFQLHLRHLALADLPLSHCDALRGWEVQHPDAYDGAC